MGGCYLSRRPCRTWRILYGCSYPRGTGRNWPCYPIPQICGIKDWYEDQRRYIVLFYKATRFEGELRSSSEGKVWWENVENLSNLNLALDMKDMIRVFTDDDLSEFFYYQEGNKWKYELK